MQHPFGWSRQGRKGARRIVPVPDCIDAMSAGTCCSVNKISALISLSGLFQVRIRQGFNLSVRAFAQLRLRVAQANPMTSFRFVCSSNDQNIFFNTLCWVSGDKACITKATGLRAKRLEISV
ncbi:MAG: hypothetical protein NTY50_16965 [Methylobacter sp.]|nr:hypothetical protein [Methylobacter sp.]